MVVDRRWFWTALLALSLTDCIRGDACTPGTSRACSRSLDGGLMQSGYESCESTGQWSACVSVGGCNQGGTSLPLYSRCTGDDQCGPTGCAFCNDYVGVDNPHGYSVCYVYCQADSDCAPTTASTNVTPRCVLGQCTLLCRTGSTCPQDSQCLPWANSTLAGTYAGYDGLCE